VSIYCDINTLEVVKHLRSQKPCVPLKLLLCSTTPIMFISQHIDMCGRFIFFNYINGALVHCSIFFTTSLTTVLQHKLQKCLHCAMLTQVPAIIATFSNDCFQTCVAMPNYKTSYRENCTIIFTLSIIFKKHKFHLLYFTLKCLLATVWLCPS
jgi:hypothetical protein